MRRRRATASAMDAEVEMLQTDIMRFMAIIALCLLAIFAIVQSLGEVEAPQPPPVAALPEPAPVSRPAPQPAAPEPLQAKPQPAPEPQPKPPPEPKPAPSPEGFSLKFADDAALISLLRSGQAQLQVQRGQDSWVWRNGGFQPGRQSGDFYGLDTSTVPLTLRQQALRKRLRHGSARNFKRPSWRSARRAL